MNKRFWRLIHRWSGLLLAGCVVFYCATGLLLNHRQRFGYFQKKITTSRQVTIADERPLMDFIASYRRQIDRADSPRVIRIRDNGVIEFLYGSHGRTTYVIDPRAGTMTRIDKQDIEPWQYLNRLHKAWRTSRAWLVLADAAAVLLVLVTISGLFVPRYRRLDWWLLAGGVVVLALALMGG